MVQSSHERFVLRSASLDVNAECRAAIQAFPTVIFASK